MGRVPRALIAGSGRVVPSRPARFAERSHRGRGNGSRWHRPDGCVSAEFATARPRLRVGGPDTRRASSPGGGSGRTARDCRPWSARAGRRAREARTEPYGPGPSAVPAYSRGLPRTGTRRPAAAKQAREVDDRISPRLGRVPFARLQSLLEAFVSGWAGLRSTDCGSSWPACRPATRCGSTRWLAAGPAKSTNSNSNTHSLWNPPPTATAVATYLDSARLSATSSTTRRRIRLICAGVCRPG